MDRKKLQRIIALCKTIADDSIIADYMEVDRDVVRDLRELAGVKNVKASDFSHIPSKEKDKPDFDPDEVAYRDEVKAMKRFSDTLLIRQLETGQHWLSKERFMELIDQLGLRHRLPRHLRFA